MKNKKKLTLLVLFLITHLIFFSHPVKAIIDNEITVSTLVEKDSHVESNNPYSNYGDWSQLRIGNYNKNWKETYLFFNFTDKPENWILAKISIKLTPISSNSFC